MPGGVRKTEQKATHLVTGGVHNRLYRFTSEDDRVIRDNYGKMPIGDVVALLRYRVKAGSLRARAQRLGVTIPRGSRKNRKTPFTSAWEQVKKRQRGLELAKQTGPIPVSPALAKLAAFDPIFARVLREKQHGLPPGHLIINYGHAVLGERDV